MTLAHLSPHRPPHGWSAFVTVLVLLCLVAQVTPVAAAGAGDSFLTSSPCCWGAPAFIGDILGNRTRMIQVACVIGAIGIVFLTRSMRQ
jgi:hypothetical protein